MSDESKSYVIPALLYLAFMGMVMWCIWERCCQF